jgi:hypothetical protein
VGDGFVVLVVVVGIVNPVISRRGRGFIISSMALRIRPDFAA